MSWRYALDNHQTLQHPTQQVLLFTSFLFSFLYFPCFLVSLVRSHSLKSFLSTTHSLSAGRSRSILYKSSLSDHCDILSLTTVLPNTFQAFQSSINHHACPKLRSCSFEQDVLPRQDYASDRYDHHDRNYFQLHFAHRLFWHRTSQRVRWRSHHCKYPNTGVGPEASSSLLWPCGIHGGLFSTDRLTSQRPASQLSTSLSVSAFTGLRRTLASWSCPVSTLCCLSPLLSLLSPLASRCHSSTAMSSARHPRLLKLSPLTPSRQPWPAT